MSVIVFAGPTISADTVRAILEAEVRPPVKQGDIYRAVRDSPRMIGIIDGYFEGVPSVWHKEILWAMEQGVAVFGSGSMGALRAAELAPFGMIGVGRIFEAYLDRTISDDDEVAVLHSPAELGYKPLSEPMVSVRATVERGQEEGRLSDVQADALLTTAKAIHYRQRTWDVVLKALGSAHPGPEFETWLLSNLVDAKQEDAVAMLHRMAEGLASDASPVRPERMEQTLVWKGLVRRIEAERDGTDHSAQQVLDELRLDPSAFREIRDRAALRLLAQGEGARDETPIDRDALVARMARHREESELPRRADLLDWLAENDLDEAGYERLLRGAIRTEEAIAGQAHRLTPYMLDALRLADRYVPLKARAQAKNAALGAEKRGESITPNGLRHLVWYFETVLGREIPDDLDAYAHSIGLADRAAFFELIQREFLYCREMDG